MLNDRLYNTMGYLAHKGFTLCATIATSILNAINPPIAMPALLA